MGGVNVSTFEAEERKSEKRRDCFVSSSMPPPEKPSTADRNTGVGFPLFAVAFSKDGDLLVAGGGGAGRSGVKNKVIRYKLNPDGEDQVVAEHCFSHKEDAPMCMATHPQDDAVFVCGANSEEEVVKKGENKNFRVFKLKEKCFEQIKATKTLSSTDMDDYQKVAVFDTEAKYMGIGTSNGAFTVLKYPSLDPAFEIKSFDNEEVYDVDFSEDGQTVAAISDSHLKICNVSDGSSVQTIGKPILNKKMACQFRCLRYGRKDTSRYLYMIVNPANRNRGFVCQWDTRMWQQVKKEAIARRSVTAFCVSPNGKYLGFGSQDLGVGVVDAITLKLLQFVPEVHGLPTTCITFDAEARRLVSVSADTSFRVTDLPEVYSTGILPSFSTILFVLVAILVLLVGVYIQQKEILPEFVLSMLEPFALHYR